MHKKKRALKPRPLKPKEPVDPELKRLREEANQLFMTLWVLSVGKHPRESFDATHKEWVAANAALDVYETKKALEKKHERERQANE